MERSAAGVVMRKTVRRPDRRLLIVLLVLVAACGPAWTSDGEDGGSALPGGPTSASSTPQPGMSSDPSDKQPASSGASTLPASPSPSAPSAVSDPPGSTSTWAPNPVWGTPVYADSFNGNTLDPNRWTIYDSPQVPLMPRSPANVSVANGTLRLTGWIDAAGRDVSGGVASRINLRYGRWEARIRVERGSGYSAVVLLWPQSEKWPVDGEIDVIEVPDPQRQVGSNFLHFGSDNRQLEKKCTLILPSGTQSGWNGCRIVSYIIWTVSQPGRSGGRRMRVNAI